MSERVIPCSDAVRQLWHYLDNALSPEDQARVDGHLAFCRRLVPVRDQRPVP